ncbi:MAG: MarC family protein [Victivallaceae bacterium]|nr:MarC family protein [Victivallaceae bacterium]
MSFPGTAEWIGLIVRLTLLLTPFFVFSVFLSLATEEQLDGDAQKKLAHRTTVAVMISCMVIYFFGRLIFQYLGISIDAFRIGAGLVLLLNGIDLVRSKGIPAGRKVPGTGDPSVVPLAIPYTVGPGTIGTLIVMGATGQGAGQRIAVAVAIAFASLFLGIILHFANTIERVLKERGIGILTKLTGMYIVALASQIIFTGVRNLIAI